MRAKIWGCRGSLAAPGPETIRYGGNTSCFELRLSDGSLVLLDAGTGIRPFGIAIADDRPERIDLLLTHLHLDHLEGLGFFGPLWDSQTELHIWGPPSPVKSLEDRIATYLSPPLFPVHLSDVPSTLVFHDAREEPWELGAATISSSPISHPGPTVGYRIEEGGVTLAYLTDHEPALGVDLDSVSTEWISGFQVAERADLLIHDGQYTAEEYKTKVGWGHSSTEHVVRFAALAKVGRMLTYHHDPMHADADIDAMVAHAKELWEGDAGDCDAAREGMELDLS